MLKDNRELFIMGHRRVEGDTIKHVFNLGCKTIFFCLAIIGAEDVLRLFFGG